MRRCSRGSRPIGCTRRDYETQLNISAPPSVATMTTSSINKVGAQVRLLQGEFETAKKEFERILKQEPTAHQAIFGLGYAEVQLGEYDNGRQRFDYLLTHHTGEYQTNAELFYQAGVAFEGMEIWKAPSAAMLMPSSLTPTMSKHIANWVAYSFVHKTLTKPLRS